jgi:hypothetical protein
MNMISHKSPLPPIERISWGLHVLLTAMALVFLGVSLCCVLPQRALDSSGRTTTGTIAYVSRSKTVCVTYTYKVGNQTFTHQNAVDGYYFQGARSGDSLNVTYLPNRPSLSRPEASTDAAAGYMMLWGTGIFGILVLAILGTDIGKRVAGSVPPSSSHR